MFMCSRYQHHIYKVLYLLFFKIYLTLILPAHYSTFFSGATCGILISRFVHFFRCDMGDSDVPFCIQSCSKPLTYGLAVSELGAQTVHSYVGLEPSGRSFNELTLDHNRE